MKLLKLYSMCIICTLSIGSHIYAQNDSDETKTGFPNVKLGVQNMFYWRGAPLSVFSTEEHTPTPLITGEFNYTKGAFTAGFWTGQSFSSEGYKNASYYVNFKHKNFQLSIWDIYTYSGVAETKSKNFFNFKNEKTQHFIDLNASYEFKKVPISIYLASIIYGRDGALINNDYENRYSTYLKLNYNLKVANGYSFDFYISGAGALNNIDDTNFYETAEASHPYGISEIGITAHKSLKLSKNYSTPISVGAIFSPMNKRLDGLITIEFL
ncbi:hypothetical protein SAMN05444483_11347 [Salegentibacter echinorum]|uniref:MetA-pathway of phenol degradation n=1 Tax=Salegentibacter echinorum TaxID=1073325 RepID=A0A1M5K568_SALEC|nr:hypothetical protein [Salegentibacter echinorum]SHG47841.1 hypothetical protein SAMN05444483_11347 [Salegentibacter echinorum]